MRNIGDGQVFTQPWPATQAQKSKGRRDKVIHYQYRADRARRTLRGIDEQVAKAESAVAGLIEDRAGWSINKFVITARRCRTVQIPPAKNCSTPRTWSALQLLTCLARSLTERVPAKVGAGVGAWHGVVAA